MENEGGGGESREASFPNKETNVTKGKAGYSVRCLRFQKIPILPTPLNRFKPTLEKS